MPQPPPSSRATAIISNSNLHPEVDYWRNEWMMIRDSVLGEVEVKRKAELYLPKLSTMTREDYAAFLQRAVFFNMTSRTITGLVGKIFRRPPIVKNIPSKIEDSLLSVTKDGQSLTAFANLIATEVFTIGRYGVLLDMDPAAPNQPYMTGYLAENIIDWATGVVNGREQLTEVTLREIRLENTIGTAGVLTRGSLARRYLASYRVLRLEPVSEGSDEVIYRQYVYHDTTGNAALNGEPDEVHTPNHRGVPFDEIPFKFFGPQTNLPSVEKSPVLDIVRLNMSHYRSYAQLEHGLFYTALPVYYAPVKEGQSAEYTIGPSVVWLVGEGQKPGILEFNGQGLKFLENALTTKEAQAAALGGRLMGMTAISTAESDNAVKLKEANEQALLLNVAGTVDDGLTWLLRKFALWADVPENVAKKLAYEMNRDFVFDMAAAREFRAIHAMYLDGVLPIEVVYDYLRRAEVIPDWMPMDEFKELLDKHESFPGQPDAHAKIDGEPGAQSGIDVEQAALERRHAMQLETLRGHQQQEQAKINAAAAKATATAAAKAAAKAKPAGKPAAGGQKP